MSRLSLTDEQAVKGLDMYKFRPYKNGIEMPCGHPAYIWQRIKNEEVHLSSGPVCLQCTNFYFDSFVAIDEKLDKL